jgi:hypothetical protein
MEIFSYTFILDGSWHHAWFLTALVRPAWFSSRLDGFNGRFTGKQYILMAKTMDSG